MKVIGLVLCLSALAACEVSPLPDGTPDAFETRDRDVEVEVETKEVESDLVSCTPGATPSPCKAGQFCETHALVCVDCVSYQQRCVGTGSSSQRETCEQPVAIGIGNLDSGGFYETDRCPSGEVCVANNQGVSCKPRVCEPNVRQCDAQGNETTCNAAGTAVITKACGAGEACYADGCEQLRHNVLLIFDTSQSMLAYINRDYSTAPGSNTTYSPERCDSNPNPCYAWPECDDPEAPLSLFTESKNVFTSAVTDSIGRFSQFALQRFPQVEAPGQNGACDRGWYSAQALMTGDDDARTTDGATWFKDNLSEVLVVPFPVRRTIDNTEDLLSWIDHTESLRATSKECTVNADCGVRGYCGNYNGAKRCFEHSDPELRAVSQTPLGKSLFYAGEYFRRFVRVDGKACTTDESCDSAGYRCGEDGKCYDTYAECKDDFIILFTDGGESFHGDVSSFFNPIVQAKRLAYGLECAQDSDCRGGATCTAIPDANGEIVDHLCVGPGQTPRPRSQPQLARGDGFGALSSPGGTPISIKTTVITLNASEGTNPIIAASGGGVHLNVSATEPEEFADLLFKALTPDFKCKPQQRTPGR